MAGLELFYVLFVRLTINIVTDNTVNVSVKIRG